MKLPLLACLAGTLVALLTVSSTRADERDFPCEGCVVVGERGVAAKPLLVVLHGDEGGPSRVAALWTAVAKKRGVVALFPNCPRKEGCTTGSFWRWNGEPSWLLAEVAQLEAAYGIDPKRRYLAGWSGGTTYLTFRFASWFPTFAAVSLTGGGARGGSPCFSGAGGTCGPFLYRMGERNPLFDLADNARKEIESCGHAVEWKVLPGLDHEGEWSAYARDAESVLDWLLTHEEGCSVEAEAPTASAAGSTTASSAVTSAVTSAGRPNAPTTSGAPPAAPRCQCGVVASDTSWGDALVGVVLLVAALHRSRSRSVTPRARFATDRSGGCRWVGGGTRRRRHG